MYDWGRPRPVPILDPINLNNLDIFEGRPSPQKCRQSRADRDMQSSAEIKKKPVDHCGFLEIKAGCFLLVLWLVISTKGNPQVADWF